jgi:hypothetical protein
VRGLGIARSSARLEASPGGEDREVGERQIKEEAPMGKYRLAPPSCVGSLCVARSAPSDLGGGGRWAAGIAVGAVFANGSLGNGRLIKVGFSFLLGKKEDRVALSSLWCE